MSKPEKFQQIVQFQALSPAQKLIIVSAAIAAAESEAKKLEKLLREDKKRLKKRRKPKAVSYTNPNGTKRKRVGSMNYILDGRKVKKYFRNKWNELEFKGEKTFPSDRAAIIAFNCA